MKINTLIGDPVPRKLLITGATGDIGSAVAKIASTRGWETVVSGKSSEKLENLRLALSLPYANAVQADFSSPDASENVVSKATAAMGGIDSIVHCTGIQNTATLNTLSATQIRETLDINFQSALLLTKAFRDKRITKVNPSIVFVSSVAALKGHSGESLYAGSKAALIASARSLSLELAPQKIRVNTVAPGAVMGSMTEQIRLRIGEKGFEQLSSRHPLGLGTPENIAEAILFLSSPLANWITGETLVVDGGYSAT